jgi:threonine dehydrogenase-like Zn-dependent dehydrogenase
MATNQTNQTKEVVVTEAIVAWEPLEPLKPNYSLEDVVVYPPAEGDILVEVRAAGICHTDNLLCSVPRGIHGVIYPKVGGHEGSLPPGDNENNNIEGKSRFWNSESHRSQCSICQSWR